MRLKTLLIVFGLGAAAGLAVRPGPVVKARPAIRTTAAPQPARPALPRGGTSTVDYREIAPGGSPAGGRALAACPACREPVESTLKDVSRSLSDRLALARASVASGSPAGTLAVVEALRDAALAGDVEYREGLIEVLADAAGVESAAALVEAAAGADFGEWPDDIRAAVAKALRLNPSAEATGAELAQRNREAATPEVRRNLETIGQRWMFAKLAEDAAASAEAERRVRGLVYVSDSAMPEVLAFLVEKGVVSAAVVGDVAREWAGRRAEAATLDRYSSELLSESDANPAARAVAAALAGSGVDAARMAEPVGDPAASWLTPGWTLCRNDSPVRIAPRAVLNKGGLSRG